MHFRRKILEEIIIQILFIVSAKLKKKFKNNICLITYIIVNDK